MLRFLFDGKGFTILIKLNHAIFTGVTHIITKNSSSGLILCSLCNSLQNLGKTLSIENIISQNQCHTVITNKFFTNNKCVSQSSGNFLDLILKFHTQTFTRSL